MQLFIVSDGCILENHWPIWALISFVLLMSILLFVFMVTCCCVAARKAEEPYPEKKQIKSLIKQKTQSLPSSNRPSSPKKQAKSKDKSKKKYEQKQKKEPTNDLETAAYLTQTFYPIPLEPRGTQRTPTSQMSEKCMPESILVVRPPSDEKLSPMIEKERPVSVKTARQVERTPSIPSNKEGSNEVIHVETFPVITISAGQEGDIEAVIRQSLKGGQFDFPEKKNKEGKIRHQKKSD
ncbi:hypothetical protein ACQ4LE_004139 [Meloidogyne hapla]|uniref:Uncharacterized protein n=1 Tax=Meloidogyne hapla TaxID=6305 RepID=A0A1I8B412_MELHA